MGKKVEKFQAVCRLYNTSPEQALAVVVKNRRTGAILNYGSIDSERCFVNQKSGLVLIPNNWKFATSVNQIIFIGTCYYENEELLFRFTYFDGEKEQLVPSQIEARYTNPGNAFDSTLCELFPNKEIHRGTLGKLCIGVYQKNIQALLLAYFQQQQIS